MSIVTTSLFKTYNFGVIDYIIAKVVITHARDNNFIIP